MKMSLRALIVGIAWTVMLSAPVGSFAQSLFDLVEKGSAAQFNAALQAGANIEERDKIGASPLVMAAFYNETLAPAPPMLLATSMLL